MIKKKKEKGAVPLVANRYQIQIGTAPIVKKILEVSKF